MTNQKRLKIIHTINSIITITIVLELASIILFYFSAISFTYISGISKDSELIMIKIALYTICYTIGLDFVLIPWSYILIKKEKKFERRGEIYETTNK